LQGIAVHLQLILKDFHERPQNAAKICSMVKKLQQRSPELEELA
jgi:hypothetical protein